MSNQNLQEVEVKLYTPDLAQIHQSLHKAGAIQEKDRIRERNIRYENNSETLTRQGIVLRMRQDDNARLTYKSGKQVDAGITTRFEAEVTVSDFDTMDTILQHLGFTPYMIYEKYRTTYTLSNAEIVLDEMPYGNFTEIEADTGTIEHLIDQLELTDYHRIVESYTQIFEAVKHQLGLEFRDLTFANFANIEVPDSALFSPDHT